MPSKGGSFPRTQRQSHRAIPAWLLPVAIAVAAVLAYANTLHLPFVFDDLPGVVENETIRNLKDVRTVLSPPSIGSGVTGRPVLNASLAVNYAMTGKRVESYHATNLLIHLAAGLALFGILRRTLSRPAAGGFSSNTTVLLAGSVALLWLLHPLQTESVTCIIQRTESLMGLFYLTAIYAFIRSLEADALTWRIAAVVACAVGMATKEVMVSAPLLMLLYDRTFDSVTFAAAWRRRRGFYIALAATWVILAALVLSQHGSRGNTEAGPVIPTIAAYAATQATALMRYVWLAVWPHPLVLDYGTALVSTVRQCFVPAVLIVTALVWAFGEVRRGTPAGLLAAWFFFILAPSSSVVPLLPQPVAEHRMYLPLAALLVAGAVLAYRFLGRRAALPAGLIAAAALALTVHRNTDFRTVADIWKDTIAKVPQNARAYYNLACEIGAKDYPTAIALYERGIALDPGYSAAHNNLGQALGQVGDRRRAILHLRIALSMNPKLVDARGNLGIQLFESGFLKEAQPYLESNALAQPNDAQAHGWLGNLYTRQGQYQLALEQYAMALKLQENYPAIEVNYAAVLLLVGQVEAGAARLVHVLNQNPALVDARKNLIVALEALGRKDEAAVQRQVLERMTQPQR